MKIQLQHRQGWTALSKNVWNQLPSFRQPHPVHAPPGSPHPVCITSSQSSPSLSPSITPSAFYSRLKNSSVSLIVPSIVFLVHLECLHRPWTRNVLKGHWRLFVLVSSSYILCFWFHVLARLNLQQSAFQSMLNSLVSYTKISTMQASVQS